MRMVEFPHGADDTYMWNVTFWSGVAPSAMIPREQLVLVFVNIDHNPEPSRENIMYPLTSIRRGKIPDERRLTERLRVQVRHPRTAVSEVAVGRDELGPDAEAGHFELVRLGVVAQDRGHHGLPPEESLERVVAFDFLALVVS